MTYPLDHQPERLIAMTAKQAQAASGLELGLQRLLHEIGPTHAKTALFDAVAQTSLPVGDLRYLSRMIDRLADHRERAADMRG